ncbi:MAG: MBL fold metallo-hydrolase [Actinomycetota bacterium]
MCPGAEPTSFVADGDLVDLGDRSFVVVHVPGHTPGSVALWEEATGLLLTGDMLYLDDHLGFDDPDAARSSLARMRELAHAASSRATGSRWTPRVRWR